MSKTTCDSCDRPTSGAKLCEKCQITLAISLVNVADYFDDLTNVATKTIRYSTMPTRGSIGKDQPLPVDGRFADKPGQWTDNAGKVHKIGTGTELRLDTWDLVTKWAAHLMREAGRPIEPACQTCIHPSCVDIRRRRWPTTSTIRGLVVYFDRQFRFIVRAPWAADFLTEMLDLEKRLRRLIDRPADRWYAGKCSAPVLDPNNPEAECKVDLYATTESGAVKCPGCGTIHDIASRRGFLLDEAKDYQVTAVEAARALIAWTDYDGTETKLVDRIRKWRDRDHLAVQDVTSLNGRDRHLYRLGDIQQLLVGDAQAAQIRRLA